MLGGRGDAWPAVIDNGGSAADTAAEGEGEKESEHEEEEEGSERRTDATDETRRQQAARGERQCTWATMGTEAQQQAEVLANTVLEPTTATEDQFYECLEHMHSITRETRILNT